MRLPRPSIAEMETRSNELEELDKIARDMAWELLRGPGLPTRDARGRWLPGASGNKHGRPRKKVVRALSSRQVRNAFLAALEAPRTVMTPNGPEERPAIDIILESMTTRAAKGHAPLQRFIIKRHAELVDEVAREDRELFSRIERIEDMVAQLSRLDRRLSPAIADQVDKVRKKARRI